MSPMKLSPGESQLIEVVVHWDKLYGTGDTEQIIVQSNDEDMNPYPDAVMINVGSEMTRNPQLQGVYFLFMD
mgnify:CR=1 FL=1